MSYFTQALEQGSAEAAHALSFLHATGMTGLSVDEESALHLEERAALGGSMHASMALGYRYLHGYGVPQDCERALLFYRVGGWVGWCWCM
jgi:TPR repeat protein